MTPQQAESIVNEAIREMMANPSCTPEIIAMVTDHLRATLAPLVTLSQLVRVETEEQT